MACGMELFPSIEQEDPSYVTHKCKKSLQISGNPPFECNLLKDIPLAWNLGFAHRHRPAQFSQDHFWQLKSIFVYIGRSETT